MGTSDASVPCVPQPFVLIAANDRNPPENAADAARCAHSQYRNEKAAVQHALETVNDALHWVAGRIDFRESQLALLIDKACGPEVEVPK